MERTSPTSRAASNAGSDNTHKSKRSHAYRLSIDDIWMPPTTNIDMAEFKFVNCSVAGCGNTSAFSEYSAITLRAGFDTCTMHTHLDSVANKVKDMTVNENTVYIFYDIEVTGTNEIDQLSAVSTAGHHIDLIVKTTTRKNNSPIVSRLTPLAYMVAAMEPLSALMSFVSWVRRVAYEMSNGTATESDVVMVAHNGMCHDHVFLLKKMIVWGMKPPAWRFSDSLPIFKIVVNPSEVATLSVLADRYAPWFSHVQHDSLSDSRALMHVVVKAIGNWQAACYVFSSSCEYFTTSVGLNIHRIRRPLPFPDVD